MKTISILLIASILAGCSTPPHKISSSSVSPLQYRSLDCEQIEYELMRVNSRMNDLAGRLDQAATNDKLIFAAGMLLVWPALFALGGTKQQEAEYARLKGEHEALTIHRINQKCV